MPRKPANSHRTDIVLTREGWIYLGVLCFITLGSILRNVNLLILMAGMMIAPLIFNWRLIIYWLRMVSARRLLPRQIHAEQTTSIQYLLLNRSKITTWSIGISDSLTKLSPVHSDQSQNLPSDQRNSSSDHSRETHRSAKWDNARNWFYRLIGFGPQQRPVNIQVECPLIGGNQEETATCKIYFPERGLYQIGPAILSTSFPFGLIRASRGIARDESCFVAPRLGHLTPVWDRRIRSVLVGSDSIARRRGIEEDEFHALRPWQAGDSTKQIHWRTTARMGALTVKQFEQPDNRDFAMLLDLFCPEFGDADEAELQNYRSKCETALSFAATVLLGLDAIIRGRIAVAICGSETNLIHGRIHREIIGQTMPKLAVATPSANPSLTSSLIALAESVSATTPLFVVSSRSLAGDFDFLNVRETELGGNVNRADSAVSPPSVTPSLSISPSASVSVEDLKWQSRIRQIWPTVTWIDVDSDGFREMFHQDHQQASTLKKLAAKWGKLDAAH